MKHLLFNSSMALLLNIPYAIGSTSYIAETATLNVESEAKLYITESDTLSNSGTIAIEDAAIIDIKGCLENNKAIILKDLASDGSKNFILSGEGSIQVKSPGTDAMVSSIEIKEEGVQTISAAEEENASLKIEDLQIEGTLEKQDSLNLDVDASHIQGNFILDGGNCTLR